MTCCSATGCSCVDYAGADGVSEACRAFGVHRSTYYLWKRRVERHGLEILRPRERRRPRMPNQLSPFVEERIVAFALGHPGFGPRRIASELAPRALGRDRRQPQRRLALPAPARPQHAREAALSWSPATRRPTSRRASREPRAARRGRAARRAGRHRLLLRRPPHRHEGLGLAADRDRRRTPRLPGPSSSAARSGNPTGEQTSKLARRVCAELAGGRLAARARAQRQRRRVPLADFRDTLDAARRPPHPDPRRPPADQRGASRRCTGRSSRSAGDPPSPATSTSASPASSATSSS